MVGLSVSNPNEREVGKSEENPAVHRARKNSSYRPSGFNLGMDLGESAGAGIAEHIHMQVLPRWRGDTNFMTAVAETRVLLEDLTTTWRKLRDAFAKRD